MPSSSPRASFSPADILKSWWHVLSGHVPMLSIEITRECPLSCPGCYAYGETHLSGTTLRQLSDFRGDALVDGVLKLVREKHPLHVSLVGGEPLVRHRELDRILPALNDMGVFTMIATSAVIPIPEHWMAIPRLKVAVSVDGLAEDHDIRRKPATYERILKNIAERKVNIHWVITRPMLRRAGYLEEYLAFWNSREEVDHIWVSLYTPQVGEESAEMLSAEDRANVARELIRLRPQYRKLFLPDGIGRAFVHPPANPNECLFAKMSLNYSADLKTRVEPCIFGGTPDCSQCGCAISSGLHWMKGIRAGKLIPIDYLVRGSMAIGSAVAQFGEKASNISRWRLDTAVPSAKEPLVQINR